MTTTNEAVNEVADDDIMVEHGAWAANDPHAVVAAYSAQFRAERRYARAVRKMITQLRRCCRERLRVVVELRDGSLCAGHVARVTDDSFFFENGDEVEFLAVAELECQP